MIAFILVVIAYGLGHVGGFRLCKFRYMNRLRRHIQDNSKQNTPYSAAIVGVYSSMLHEVNNL